MNISTITLFAISILCFVVGIHVGAELKQPIIIMAGLASGLLCLTNVYIRYQEWKHEQ